MDPQTLGKAAYIEALVNTCKKVLRYFPDIANMNAMTYTDEIYMSSHDVTCAGKVIRVAVPTLHVTAFDCSSIKCKATFTFTSKLDDICDDEIVKEAAARLQPFLAEYFKFSKQPTKPASPQPKATQVSQPKAVHQPKAQVSQPKAAHQPKAQVSQVPHEPLIVEVNGEDVMVEDA